MITKRVQYRYDSVRNKIGMTDADGGLHTYTYDVMRRLTGVINPLGERTTYAYDLNGRRTSVQLANGTRTSYVYDVMSRVQSVHTLKSDDSTVSKFEYEYDGNGRRTSVLEADGSRVTWTYDRISQVTSEWRTGTNPHRHTFTYDSVGNRTLKIEDGARTTLVYDACNQLLTSEDNSGTTTFTYDGNGNQTVIQKPNGDRTTMVWDYENRLIKTIQPSGGVTSMAYDADGLRLKKEDAAGTKLFVWDDQNYLAETDAAGTTQTAFTTEPSTYGGLISHRKAGATTTYHFDALGSTRALTDESESLLERYNYTAFGNLLDSPTLHTPFLWGGMVGYYWDAELATQYIRARHYQPTIARWISLDPIGFAGGDANLFRYVGNSPTSGSVAFQLYPFSRLDIPSGLDPSGLYCLLYGEDNTEIVSRLPMGGNTTGKVGITITTNYLQMNTCGAFEWQIKWGFRDPDPPSPSFIVQHVKMTVKMTDCSGHPMPDRSHSLELWEAWPYSKADGLYARGQDTYGVGEHGTTRGGRGTKGTVVIEAEYGLVLGLLYTPFQYNNPDVNGATIGPATPKNPHVDTTAPMRKHNLVAKWSCCRCLVDTDKACPDYIVPRIIDSGWLCLPHSGETGKGTRQK